MSEKMARELSETWEFLDKRRYFLKDEIRQLIIKKSNLEIELRQVEEMIDGIVPLSKLEAVFNYVHSFDKTTNKEVME